jgi:hypothetical protein
VRAVRIFRRERHPVPDQDGRKIVIGSIPAIRCRLAPTVGFAAGWIADRKFSRARPTIAHPDVKVSTDKYRLAALVLQFYFNLKLRI